MSRIVGICPAAGKGTRLAPFPGSKELFPIGFQTYQIDGLAEARPKVVSQYLLDNMLTASMTHLFMVLGPGKQDIMEFYGDGHRWGCPISYLFQEVRNGLPYALDLAYPLLNDDDVVIFGMPDTIIEPHNAFEQLLAYHLRETADLTLGLFPTDKPQKFGMVNFDESHNVVTCIDKPQVSDLKYLWGAACWSGKFTNYMHEYLQRLGQNAPTIKQEVVLGDIFQSAINSGLHVKGFCFEDGLYMDIGTGDDLNTAIRYILDTYPAQTSL